jgi:dihydropteroate synthase
MNSKKQLGFAHSTLDLQQPKIMGILNVTPDSFSDGGQFNRIDAALHQVESMINDGASIIDIGGESTRPGAVSVSEREELTRVIPLLKAIKQRFSVLVSIDTSKAVVMAEAISQQADMINDVRAAQNSDALKVLAQSEVPICLMHMQGLPSSMQVNPQYQDVINDLVTFFNSRITACANAGIGLERLVIDPGFGFGKTLQQNYQLLAHLNEFRSLNCPILIGLSRKSMIGDLLNCDVQQRLVGSVAAAMIAVQNGADIVRVHDVKATADALAVWHAVATAN